MLELDQDSRAKLWDRLIAAVEDYTANLADHRCAPQVDPQAVRRLVESVDFAEPSDPVGALDFVVDALWKYQVHVPHPRYYGLFNPAPATMAIAGDMLAAAFNPQLAAWSHNPIGCEIERHLIRTIGHRFGYALDEVDGSFTSGGAEANHTALLTALVHRFPEYVTRGAPAIGGKPVLYTTEESHHSIAKAARLCGIGTDAVRTVLMDSSYRMIPEDLSRQIHRDRAADCLPFMVIATVGSTSCGVIDPIPPIADVARAESLWLHVDAAWGGAAALVPQLRHHVPDIERANSITFDAHKWLSVPMAAGMYFTRHPDILEQTFAFAADYMPGAPEGMTFSHPYRQSMQWSRRFIGLKVFMSLVVAGWEGYEKTIRHQVDMGDLLREKLRSSDWEIVNDTPLPLVCFVDQAPAMSDSPYGGAPLHPPLPRGERAGSSSRNAGDSSTQSDEEGDYLEAIADTIVENGKAWISTARLGGSKTALRACITNYRTQRGDIEALVHDLNWARKHLKGR